MNVAEFHNFIDQTDITNIYTPLHLTAAEYTSQAHMEYTPTKAMLWALKHNMTNLKWQKSYYLFSDHTETKVGIKNK